MKRKTKMYTDRRNRKNEGGRERKRDGGREEEVEGEIERGREEEVEGEVDRYYERDCMFYIEREGICESRRGNHENIMTNSSVRELNLYF